MTCASFRSRRRSRERRAAAGAQWRTWHIGFGTFICTAAGGRPAPEMRSDGVVALILVQPAPRLESLVGSSCREARTHGSIPEAVCRMHADTPTSACSFPAGKPSTHDLCRQSNLRRRRLTEPVVAHSCGQHGMHEFAFWRVTAFRVSMQYGIRMSCSSAHLQDIDTWLAV